MVSWETATLESRSAPAKVLDQAAAVSAGAGSTARSAGRSDPVDLGDNLFGQLGDGIPGRAGPHRQKY